MLLITTSVVKLTTIITKKKTSTNVDPGSNHILNFQWKGKHLPNFCLFHTNLFVTIITLIMWFLINNCTRHLCKQWYLFDLFSIVIHSFIIDVNVQPQRPCIFRGFCFLLTHHYFILQKHDSLINLY